MKLGTQLVHYMVVAIAVLAASPLLATTNNISEDLNQLPDCSTSWDVAGDTYTCEGDGTVSFTSGNDYIADSNSTIIANNGFIINNNTIGSSAVSINLITDYGEVANGGDRSTLWGNIESSSGVINLENTNVNGSINISAGSVTLIGGRVTELVNSSCCSITTEGTDLLGGASSQSDTVRITGGRLEGEFTSSGGSGVQISNANLTSGSITTENVPINIVNSRVGSSTNSVNLATNNNTTLTDTIMTGNVDSGTFSASGITAVTGSCNPDPGGDFCSTDPPTMTCSDYHGQGTINEIYRSGNSRFIEVKVLNTNVPQGQYRQWELTACRDDGVCTDPLPLSEAEDSFPWFTYSGDQLPGQGGNNVVQLDEPPGMDILLVDGSGNTIDYVRVSDSGNYQSPGSCLPAYDWRIGPSNTALVARVPDGTGNWGISGPGGSFGEFPPTEGDGNDEVDTPDDEPAVNVDIRNVEIAKGETANFEIFLSETRDYEITVDYQTEDGPAVANEDYIPVQGTAVFEPNEDSVTIPVDTISDGPAELDDFFYLTISNADPGVIINHFATATFTELSRPEDSLEYIELEIKSQQALTCRATPVTFRACANEDCSILYEDQVQFTATSSNSGQWVGGAGFDFDTGETTRLFSRTQTGTTELGIDMSIGINPSPEGDPEFRCANGNCSINFVDIAILLDGDITESELDSSIPLQIAGKPSNQGVKATNKLIRVVQTDPHDTAACIPALENETLEASFSYAIPEADLGLADNQITIEGESSGILENDGVTQNVQLAFDEDGTAPFHFTAQDAGQYRLDIEMDIPVTDEDGTPVGGEAEVVGSSNVFNVRPLAVFADASGNPQASGHDGPAFTAAGDDFTLSFKPIRWTADRDSNNDGTWDNACEDATLSDPDDYARVPNWNIGEPSPNLIAPSGGNDGTLTYSSGGVVFPAGVDVISADDVSYSEVGIIRVDDTVYFYGDEVQVCSPNIGRFIPAYFKLGSSSVSSNHSLENRHSGEGGFTYIGQPFSYQHGNWPNFDVIPHSVEGSELSNYFGNFFRLDTTHDLSRNYVSTDHNQDMTLYRLVTSETSGEQSLEVAEKDGSSELRVSMDPSPEQFAQIELINDVFEFNKSYTPIAPFTPAITLTLPAPDDPQDPDARSDGFLVDADGVCFQESYSNGCEELDWDIESPELLDGRLRLRSAQGPFGKPLRMEATIQYWDGDSYVALNRNSDTFTPTPQQSVLEGPDAITSTSFGITPDPEVTDISEVNDHGNDEAILILAPVSKDNFPQGLRRTVKGDNIPPYLRADWNRDDSLVGPRATASFGTYEGRPPVLFMLPQGR